ncbi:MAG: serine/threonine protein kinase, partial [Roseiflexus sp.]|nr:serine/threonine protein kinase [Roseiflexus sp.]
ALERAYASTGAAVLRSSPVATTDIHRQATVAWRPGAATRQPASGSHHDDPPQPDSTGAPGQATRSRSLSLLPLLGGLFVFLLIVGSILAMRSGASTAGQNGAAVPVTPVVAATPPAAGDDSAALPAPTAAPSTAIAPMEAPPIAPPTAPALTDTLPPAPPAATGDALVNLRALLQSVTGDRRTGKDAQKWLRTLDEFEREIGKGNTRRARDKLRELQRDLTEAEQSGKLTSELTREALQQINAIAAAYGIELWR